MANATYKFSAVEVTPEGTVPDGNGRLVILHNADRPPVQQATRQPDEGLASDHKLLKLMSPQDSELSTHNRLTNATSGTPSEFVVTGPVKLTDARYA